MKPKTLILDIETSPIEGYAWGIWEQNIGLDMIKTDWSILAFCANWLGKRETIYADTGGRGASKVRDDLPLLSKLHALLDEADIVVAQNGKKFDIRKINARLIEKGYKPYSPIRVVDTLTVARKHFGFTSNKLAWVSKLLTGTPKSDHKEFPGFTLWLECLKDNPKAWNVMRKYNRIDVLATKEYYLKLLPWIDNHPNIGAYIDGEEHTCPKCGSGDTQKRGWSVTQHGRFHRYQCNSCGGWGRGKVRLLSENRRKTILA